MEVGRVLKRLAEPQHVALTIGVADDLDAERQAARKTARHGKRAHTEIVAGTRQIAWDGRGFLDLGQRDSGYGDGRREDGVVRMYPLVELGATLPHAAQFFGVSAGCKTFAQQRASAHARPD